MSLQESQLREKRMVLLQKIFQADVREIDMHETKVSAMQELISLDIREYGGITEDVKKVVEVQGYMIEKNNTVRKKEDMTESKNKDAIDKEDNAVYSELVLKLPPMGKQTFQNLTKELKENGAIYKPKQKVWTIKSNNPNLKFFKKYLPDIHEKGNVHNKQENQSSEIAKEESYQGTAYIKREGEKQKPIVIYGNTPEDIITTFRGWNQGRTDAMKFENCYIRKLNTKSNQYENMAKYDIKTGINITPIYLSIPHIGRDEFLKIKEQLKADGAKWNPVKKRFFITQQDDLNKFSKYLPLPGTPAAQGENLPKPENELNYDVEVGQDYYDNRIHLSVEGYAPFNVYGDDYNIHFPSMKSDEIKEVIEKFVIPNLVEDANKQKLPKEILFEGKSYDPMQYNVIQRAQKQNFTNDQMKMILRPELSSERMDEVRFAIMDKLTTEQISKFAKPEFELWQMDICRIGMQNGISFEELKPIINPDKYSSDQWGQRRNQLQVMIREKKLQLRQQVGLQPQDKKVSIMDKINENKAQIEAQKGTKTKERVEVKYRSDKTL